MQPSFHTADTLALPNDCVTERRYFQKGHGIYLPPLTNLYMSATADDKGHTPFSCSTNGAKSSPEKTPV
jgi:hypothetical protein